MAPKWSNVSTTRTFLHKGSIGYLFFGNLVIRDVAMIFWAANLWIIWVRRFVRFLLCRAAATACSLQKLGHFVPPWEGHSRGSFPPVRHKKHLYVYRCHPMKSWFKKSNLYWLISLQLTNIAYISCKFSSSPQRTVKILPPTKRSDVVWNHNERFSQISNWLVQTTLTLLLICWSFRIRKMVIQVFMNAHHDMHSQWPIIFL